MMAQLMGLPVISPERLKDMVDGKAGANEYPQLKVGVRRPHVTVRHRQGYEARPSLTVSPHSR